ncbi:hypothetical protein FJY63_03685, partial [Candidatus Sumerlaeota bacterium]|nr:hypothetical protein [Candidatus Sumerlaeota bacterium]
RKGACSSLDVVKTIAEIGGANVPGDWNGDSVAGWADDPATKWKDMAVSEYYGHNIASGYAMLRMGQYKYVYHARMDDSHGPERELYNLDSDPKEFANLANRKEYSERIAEMHRIVVRETGREPDETEQICRADYAKGYGRDKQGAKKRRKKAASDTG